MALIMALHDIGIIVITSLAVIFYMFLIGIITISDTVHKTKYVIANIFPLIFFSIGTIKNDPNISEIE